jgi:RNA polymerase sigma factor (sigma-70 family)
MPNEQNMRANYPLEVTIERDWEAVFEGLLPLAQRYFEARTSDAFLADDLTGVTMLRAWEKRKQLTGNPAAWMYSIARTARATVWRRVRAARDRPIDLDALDNEPGDDPGLEGAAISAEMQQRLRAAVAGCLSRLEQRVIYLRFYEALSSPQIARRLRMKDGHVRVIVHRALRKLRAALG